jgi:hypothetical protein
VRGWRSKFLCTPLLQLPRSDTSAVLPLVDKVDKVRTCSELGAAIQLFTAGERIGAIVFEIINVQTSLYDNSVCRG